MEKKYLDMPFQIKADDIQEGGVFSGYGSTFGGKPDSYGDVIVEGAFTESLAKGGYSGTGVKMLWAHKSDEPIGVWTKITENKTGLKVQGQLALGVQRANDVYQLMKLGALDGLSIGYNIENRDTDIEWDDKKGIRYLKKINLWEVSPVVFAANTRANITNVKTIEEATDLRELERSLRDSGMSRQEALKVISICKKSLRESGKGNEAMKDVLKSIKNLRSNIK